MRWIGALDEREFWRHGGFNYEYVNERWVCAMNLIKDSMTVERLNELRTEALEKMKRVEIECDILESRIGLTEDYDFQISEESQKKIYNTMNFDFHGDEFQVTVIIEKVVE